MMELKSGGQRTRFVVVRHAEHVAPNAPKLSRRGSLQAVALGQALKEHQIIAIYSSERSLPTALSIGQELDIKVGVDDRLSQWDPGVVRGLTREQVQERLPEVYRKRFVQRIPDYKVPQGESLNDRYKRVSSFLQDMLETHSGEEIVLVTHGGVIDDVFRTARSLPPSTLTGIMKPYGSISVVGYDSETDTWEEEECVAVSHLPQVVAEAPTGGLLYLFPHQVAGSFPLLRGDLGELCKPATQNELDIYDAFAKENHDIANFIPVYLGKLKINVEHILSNLSLLSQPLERMHDVPYETNTDAQKTSSQIEVSKDGDTKGNRKSDSESGDDVDGSSTAKLVVPKGKTPWSVTALWNRFKENRSQKVVRTANNEFVYLILENLTHGVNCPHILDLKMGTQQHGSNESAAKKASKMRKCATTTSLKLGMRVAGMQTYNQKRRQYTLKDKYWGRGLDEEGLRTALRTFVSNQSKSQRIDIMKRVIAQVSSLKKAVKKCTWRFFGCSLLIVYDAKPRKGRCQSINSDSSGDVEICTALVKKRRARSHSFSLDDSFQVSVRLIDFSHCERTTEGYDEGLLLGLDNLHRMYTSILTEEMGGNEA